MATRIPVLPSLRPVPRPDITVIPAQPGFVNLHLDQNEINIGDSVLAWRVESTWTGAHYETAVHPVTLNGDVSSSWRGCIHPDGTVTFADQTYNNLSEANMAVKRRPPK